MVPQHVIAREVLPRQGASFRFDMLDSNDLTRVVGEVTLTRRGHGPWHWKVPNGDLPEGVVTAEEMNLNPTATPSFFACLAWRHAHPLPSDANTIKF